MASTVIRGAQIKDSTVQRHDLDTSTVGQAVVTKIVQGSGINLSSTGADSGTGDVTVAASAIPLASSAQSGLLNQTSGNTTDFIDGTNNSQPLQPVIWSVRLRAFNSLGNSTFEVTQRNCGALISNPVAGAFIEDRWSTNKSGSLTGTISAQKQAPASTAAGAVTLPGTNYLISNGFMRVTLTAQQASLAAGDFCFLAQQIEGPNLRELWNDVHSLSVLVRSSVANLKFGVTIQDNAATRSLSQLCTIPSANTWTLLTFPNLPVFPSAGTYSIAPGNIGYVIFLTLAAGTTFTSLANNTWQNGNFLAAVGQSNFLGQTVGSTLDFAFVQHEPGSQCSTLIDCPFTQNYDACLRYFCKSYEYPTKPGASATYAGSVCNFNAITVNQMNGWAPFPKPMAKTPASILVYAPNTGAVNQVYDAIGGVAVAVTSVPYNNSAGINSLMSSGSFVSGHNHMVHFTADTGW